MRRLSVLLWQDDRGLILKTELIFVLTIVVIGCLTSLVALRQAVIAEAVELAQAILSLNATVRFSGQSNCQSSTAGSSSGDVTQTILEASTAASTATINQNPCD